MRKIVHIDMDAFYASVEQRDNPELRGKPIAVGHREPRGVVAAASYEARKHGVHSALPSVTAMRKCPELIFVPPRFEVYRSVSRSIRQIFAEYTALVEPLSLDEAYLDVSDNIRALPSAEQTAAEIRARIYAETGLTASAGISYNKFLAKLASDCRKPDGQFVIKPAKGAAFIEGLAIEKFHGVGPKTAERMIRLGIRDGGDLRRQSLSFLERNFGKSGSWYFAIAQGIDDRPVQPDRPRKSSGSETTFSEDLTDPLAIETEITRMAVDVWAWCEKARAFGRTVTIKVKFNDFKQITRSQSYVRCVTSYEDLRRSSIDLIRASFPFNAPVRLVGVTVSNFLERISEAQRQLSLDIGA